MHRKMGKSNGKIAALLGEKYGTVRAWLADMHRGGVASIPRRKSTGAPRKMSLKMRLKIVEAVQMGPRLAKYKGNYWTFRSLWIYAREKLGLKMAYSTAVQNFREMGLAVYISRASHPLAASAEERAAFQKKEHRRVADSAKEGYSAVFLDEGHAQAGENDNAAVGLKGIPTTRPLSGGRDKATLFVGVGADFAFIRHAPAANTDEYIKFLDRLNSLVGKIHAIADRASYHETNRSKAHIAGNADRIRVTKTIPYTPNDNAAEPQIRSIKAALANVGLDSVGAIISTLDWAIGEDVVSPVLLYRFARTDGPRIGARRARHPGKRGGGGRVVCVQKGRHPGVGRQDKAAHRGRAERQACEKDFPQKARKRPKDPCQGRRARKVPGKPSGRAPARVAQQGAARPRARPRRKARLCPRRANPRETGCASDSQEIKGLNVKYFSATYNTGNCSRRLTPLPRLREGRSLACQSLAGLGLGRGP